MTLQSILDAVGELEVTVSRMLPGDPGLGGVLARIEALQKEVADARGMAQPLVPDAVRSASTAESTAANIERALVSLRSAVKAKQA
jgi:hypothetical protein